ncbi:conjugative transfer signal peptidase TraF [Novosphingobium sp. PhB165]|uniref:S26 family signal peptidase n=1 Tax=Novosphingobium sp. PhB165 TaxID=2485105 RepID=UPI00104A8532|nr:S26 family signal peptidase [Novosphingobium sp. PhB165]TCM12986.1 conjugative transfer signal peptidase TraF [Novosphingobium sp. PhB165]
MGNARNLPLFEWGEALRAARARSRMLRRRAVLIGAGIAALGLTLAFPPVPRLVWNHSASAQIGLYLVSPGARAMPGDMVVAWPPEAARTLAARRHYLPSGVPLVKRVAGAAGDTICGHGDVVTIDGKPIARRLAADRSGRPLPRWEGCVRLREGSYFLLMTLRPDSFDGRYFGVTQERDILGKARPLWLP